MISVEEFIRPSVSFSCPRDMVFLIIENKTKQKNI